MINFHEPVMDKRLQNEMGVVELFRSWDNVKNENLTDTQKAFILDLASEMMETFGQNIWETVGD